MKYGSRPFGLFFASLTMRTFRLVIFACLSTAFAAHAGTKFWTGAVNGNFSNSGNWVGGTPVAGDDLIFQTTATQLVVTNDFSPNRAFNSLFFQGTNYFVRGNPILVTNGITSDNTQGANHIDADVDVRGSQFWTCLGFLAVLELIKRGHADVDQSENFGEITVRRGSGDARADVGLIDEYEGAPRTDVEPEA